MDTFIQERREARSQELQIGHSTIGFKQDLRKTFEQANIWVYRSKTELRPLSLREEQSIIRLVENWEKDQDYKRVVDVLS